MRPIDKGLWYTRGIAEDRAGRFDAAVEAYDGALRIDARDKSTWTSKGLSLLRLKRFDEALKCFDAALALDPAFEAAQSGRTNAEDRLHVAKIENFRSEERRVGEERESE